jgi:transposase
MLDKRTLEKLGGWSGYRLERVVWPESVVSREVV